MRGIQINNYFNNHITLNGKKIAQEAQPLAQTTRQKLSNVASHPQEDSSNTLSTQILRIARPRPRSTRLLRSKSVQTQSWN